MTGQTIFLVQVQPQLNLWPLCILSQSSLWSTRRATGSLEGGGSCWKSPVIKQQPYWSSTDTLTTSSECTLSTLSDLAPPASLRRDTEPSPQVWTLALSLLLTFSAAAICLLWTHAKFLYLGFWKCAETCCLEKPAFPFPVIISDYFCYWHARIAHNISAIVSSNGTCWHFTSGHYMGTFMQLPCTCWFWQCHKVFVFDQLKM